MEPENPLIPKYLLNYVAFPTFIIKPIFGIIIFICFRILKRGSYGNKVVYFIFAFADLNVLLQWQVFEFLMSFNPFSS
jgi:hypothetical protein